MKFYGRGSVQLKFGTSGKSHSVMFMPESHQWVHRTYIGRKRGDGEPIETTKMEAVCHSFGFTVLAN